MSVLGHRFSSVFSNIPRARVLVSGQRNYEAYRTGSYEMEEIKRRNFERLPHKERIRRNWNAIKDEYRFLKRYIDRRNTLRWGYNVNNSFTFDDGEIVKFWDFNQANNKIISSFDLEYKRDSYNDMKNWFVSVDADYDVGHSKASFTVSPAGYGLFSGHLDTTVPKDGNIVRTGYAYLSSEKCRKPFFIKSSLEMLEGVTHFVMRCRGDGRRYLLQFDTSTRMDDTWFDKFEYPIFTHGGPYWQYIRVPLSRFTFQYKGYLQDVQPNILPQMIKAVGILATDKFSGPFRLELDYIGFMYDSQHNDKTEYQGYYHESSPWHELASF